jgi:hypothetical protein
MPSSPTAPDRQTPKPNSRPPLARLLPSILIGAIAPVVVYRLASPHLDAVPALVLASVPPLVYTLFTWAKKRSIDIISVAALFTLGASLVATLLVHDPHLLLLRDAYLTGAFGLICLISVLVARPLAVYVYRWAMAPTPEQLAAMASQNSAERRRIIQRLITLIWAVVFLAETVLDVFLAYRLPTTGYLAVHPFLFWATLLACFGGATLYSRRLIQKAETS